MVKNLPANTEHIGDMGLSLGWEEPLEEGMESHSRILAWRIPWKEEPGGLWSIKSDTLKQLSMHAQTPFLENATHNLFVNLIYMYVSVHIYTCKNEQNFYVF